MSKILKFLNVGGENYDIGYGKTTKTITVAGTSFETIPEGTVISAGTDIDTFLTKLLVKEIYPTPNYVEPTLIGEFDEPLEISLEYTSQEVGNEVILNEVNTPSSSTKGVPAKVSGLTYGYSESLTGEIVNTQTVQSYWNNPTAIEAEDAYTLEVTAFSGFTGTAPSKAKGSVAIGKATITESSLGNISEGTNKITIKAKPPKYSGKNSGINSLFIVSNINNKDSNKKTTAIASKDVTSNNAPDPITSSASKSITGKYRCAIISNVDLTTTTIDSTYIGKQAFLDPLASGKSKTFAGPYTATSGKSIVVIVPPGYSLTGIQSSLGSDVSISEYATKNVNRIVNSNDFIYTIYTYTNNGASDVTNKNFIITKN